MRRINDYHICLFLIFFPPTRVSFHRVAENAPGHLTFLFRIRVPSMRPACFCYLSRTILIHRTCRTTISIIPHEGHCEQPDRILDSLCRCPQTIAGLCPTPEKKIPTITEGDVTTAAPRHGFRVKQENGTNRRRGPEILNNWRPQLLEPFAIKTSLVCWVPSRRTKFRKAQPNLLDARLKGRIPRPARECSPHPVRSRRPVPDHPASLHFAVKQKPERLGVIRISLTAPSIASHLWPPVLGERTA